MDFGTLFQVLLFKALTFIFKVSVNKLTFISILAQAVKHWRCYDRSEWGSPNCEMSAQHRATQDVLLQAKSTGDGDSFSCYHQITKTGRSIVLLNKFNNAAYRVSQSGVN